MKKFIIITLPLLAALTIAGLLWDTSNAYILDAILYIGTMADLYLIDSALFIGVIYSSAFLLPKVLHMGWKRFGTKHPIRKVQS